MKAGSQTASLVFWLLLPLLARADSFPSMNTASAPCPVWCVGDWWTVESQIYDRGERRPGTLPAWLPRETWRFSVLGTNAIDGEASYQISVNSEGQNACPYSFSYWFRVQDLLVLRRELHQPAASKTGRPSSAPVVQVNYSKDEVTPFVPPDFPSLPVTVPHFSGGGTNLYQAGRTRAPKSPRSFAASLTQHFHPGEHLPGESTLGVNPPVSGSAPSAPAKCGVFILTHAPDRYERQSWRSDCPWHVYAEKWEDGLVVRKCWLSESGHSMTSSAGPEMGGEK